MQYFNKDMKQILFQILEFRIVQGHSACPQQIQPVGGKWAIAYF